MAQALPMAKKGNQQQPIDGYGNIHRGNGFRADPGINRIVSGDTQRPGYSVRITGIDV